MKCETCGKGLAHGVTLLRQNPNDPKQPGHNALNQLSRRLDAARAAQPAAEPVGWQMRTRFQDREWSRWEGCADHADEPLEMSTGPLIMQFRPIYTAPQPAVPAVPQGCRELLEAVVREMDDDDGNAPGHAHEIPGVWDSDNGAISGTRCAWCSTWRLAKQVLAAAGNPVAAPARPANCSQALRASGKPYPRTCASCSLGPCKGGA